jgi:hypothetical protein
LNASLAVRARDTSDTARHLQHLFRAQRFIGQSRAARSVARAQKEVVVKNRLQRSFTLLALSSVVACDAGSNSLTGLHRNAQVAVEYPNTVGSYSGTVQANARPSWGPSYSVSCPVTINVSTQSGANYTGSFALQPARRCDTESGTIAGTVQTTGGVSFIADTPGGGANVFEDAAARSGCTLVSSSGRFGGTITGSVLSAAGNAAYNCPFFGGTRVTVDVSLSATRS